ncbi:MucR family transcriptional regulator [Novosphingobium resinovorum]|uniref:MucR family transcriptional regulator n=1 Tax=Novosphingobium resinovorum TaxID=158500 RepID=UPI002ED4EA77|nr:MucR family transcriptional regulator [Novosphingobium resinovorum]
MPETENATDVTALTVQLLSAYLANNTVASDDLAGLIRTTREALTNAEPETPAAEPEQPPVPAVSVRKSLSSPDHILSLIDGKPYKTLKRHLASNGLTPDSYRERYGLPSSYPMVAPTFAAKRRAIAEQIGLGSRRRPGAPAPEGSPAAAPVAEAAPAPEAPAKAAAKPKSKGATAKPRAAKAAPKAAAAPETAPAADAKPRAKRAARIVAKAEGAADAVAAPATVKPAKDDAAPKVAKPRRKLGMFGDKGAAAKAEAKAAPAAATTDSEGAAAAPAPAKGKAAKGGAKATKPAAKPRRMARPAKAAPAEGA